MQSTTGMKYSKILRFISESPVLWLGYCYSANHSGPQDGIGNGETIHVPTLGLWFQPEPNDAFWCCPKPSLLNTFKKINMFLRKQWFFLPSSVVQRLREVELWFQSRSYNYQAKALSTLSNYHFFSGLNQKRIKIYNEKYMRKYIIHSLKS